MRVRPWIVVVCAMGVVGALLAVPLAHPTSPAAASSLVQQKVATSASGTQVVVTLDAAPTAGNTLVLVLTSYSSVGGNAGASSIVHGSASFESGPSAGGLGEPRTQVWYLASVASSGRDVTITLNSDSAAVLSITEFSGLLTADVRDTYTSPSRTGFGSDPSTNSLNAGHAPDLLIAGVGWTGAASVSGPSGDFAVLHDAASVGSSSGPLLQAAAYRRVSQTGSYSTGWTLSASRGWAAPLLALKAVDAPTATVTPTLTVVPTPTETPVPTATATPTATPTSTATATETLTSTATSTETATATSTATETATATATRTETPIPSPTPSPTNTATETSTPTASPTATPTPQPVSTAIRVDVEPPSGGTAAAYRLAWTPGTQGAQVITITFKVHGGTGQYTLVSGVSATHPAGGAATQGFVLTQGGSTLSGWALTGPADNRIDLRSTGGSGLFLVSGQEVALTIPSGAGLTNPGAGATYSVEITTDVDGRSYAGSYVIEQQATPTPSPTATATDTATPNPTPSATATETVTTTPTEAPTQTATATSSPTETATPTATATMTITASPVPTDTPTATATITLTPTPAVTASPSATATSTFTATSTSTETATLTPTATPTSTATSTVTVTPTQPPTYTATPTNSATATRTPSPPPSTTPTPIATALPATPGPGPGQLSGRLDLRRAAQRPHASYVVDAMVGWYDAGSTHGERSAVGSAVVRTDTSGVFLAEVPSGLNGTYDVMVSVRGALPRERDRVQVGPDVAAVVSFGTMEEGDVDGDVDVDAHDLLQLKRAFGIREGQQGFDWLADLDRDGIVTLLDFSLMRGSYDRSGPASGP